MAPRQYGKLLIQNWREDKWTAMSTDAQWLYGYLCSQPSTTTAGVFPVQVTKWAKGSADMTVDRARAAAKMLVERGWIVVDHNTEEGLIRTYIRDDRAGGKVFKGALSRALEVQSPLLRAILLSEIRRLDRDLDTAEMEMVDALEASIPAGFDFSSTASPTTSPSPGTATPPIGRAPKDDARPSDNRSNAVPGRPDCTGCGRYPDAGNPDHPGLCAACITKERQGAAWS